MKIAKAAPSGSTTKGFVAPRLKKKKKFDASVSFYIGLVVILIVTYVALFPETLTSVDPTALDYTAMLQAPSSEHLFGTDNYGRDIFARVVWGARVDLAMGIFAMLIPLIVGTLVGLTAGYFGGWIDTLLMRILDIVMSFPFILLVIAIVAIMGPGLMNMFVAIWVVGWRDYARLVRSEVIVIKHSEYIEAAKVLGYSQRRIIFGHVLPNVVNSAITFAASDIVMCMLTGASLSFLGLGVQEPTAEWGAIISGGRAYLTQAWWICTFPGLALCFAGVGFSLFGDGVSDLLRAKRR